jgi:acetyl esterase/lipase
MALACWCGLLAPTLPSAQQNTEAQAKVPVADFFRDPRVIRPKLSPSGRYLAVAMAVDGARVQLAVMDLENVGPPKVVGGFRDVDINNYEWVNDQRIEFDVVDREAAANDPVKPLASGLWAVDRDGSNTRQLIDASGGPVIVTGHLLSNRKLPWQWQLHSVLSDGSNDVLVQGPIVNGVNEVVGSKLLRLDTTTGTSENLSEGVPDYVTFWVVDRQGRPAAVAGVHEGRYRAYLKSANGADWEKWQDELPDGNYAIPYWVGFDGQLLAAGRATHDTTDLYVVDPKTRRLAAEPILSMKGYDFVRGRVVYDIQAHRVLGIHFENDAVSTAWVDPTMKAAQAAVDALLPATSNRIDCQRCLSVPALLVTAASDRQPPLYYIYNRDTRALTLLGASRPWIKAQTMGARDVYRFAARDGLPIPVLVTQPPGKSSAARPAVVLVHGGPWLRGTHWEWEPIAQFLASRGYVVIEPEFRGSQGYGFRHFQAGWKQWGLAMQDDVADATNWAVKQGWVDPKRVCIAGASYGGYAVLMGLIRYPELYQCGVDWVGVTDINLMYSITWSDASQETKGYTMPFLIGDRLKDEQQLKETSPVEQAAKMRRPLLMAYGGIDKRVPIEHGKQFRDAVSQTNKDVEWIAYPDEGHGWRKLETNVDFWTRVEKFLERNLRVDTK